MGPLLDPHSGEKDLSPFIFAVSTHFYPPSFTPSRGETVLNAGQNAVYALCLNIK